MNPFMQMNLDALRVLAELRTSLTVGLFEIITLFGEEIIPIFLLCLIYWCLNKEIAYGMGFAFFASGTIVQGMKIGFRIPRPWHLDPGFLAVAEEQAKLGGSYSFPSGHTQTATAMFGTLGFAVRGRGWRIACFAMALLVGFSRLLLGVHTPLDVGVSLVLTLLIAFAAVRLVSHGNPGTDRIVLAVMLALSLGLLGFALALNGAGTITDGYTLDSIKQAASALGFALGAFAERRYIRLDIRAGGFKAQAIKYVCGLAGVFAIKEGLKPLIGSGMAPDGLRYFLLLLWIAALYPLIVKKIMAARAGKPAEA